MREFLPSLASRTLILLALLIGTAPSVQPFHFYASSQHDHKLLSPKQVPETLALVGLSKQKDFSKSLPAGLAREHLPVVPADGAFFRVSFVCSRPQDRIVSFFHNRSPPFRS